MAHSLPSAVLSYTSVNHLLTCELGIDIHFIVNYALAEAEGGENKIF